MQEITALALSINCEECEDHPIVMVLPCRHRLCYDHYFSVEWTPKAKRCAQCEKQVLKVIDLAKHGALIKPSARPCIRTPSVQAPQRRHHHRTSLTMNTHNLSGGYGRPYNDMSCNSFHPLQSNGLSSTQSFALPPLDIHQYQQRESTLTSPAPVSQFDENIGFNPSTPRFEPRGLYQDTIVRPESSISNKSFATQLPREPYPQYPQDQYPLPAGRPPYLGQQQSSRMLPLGGGYSSVANGVPGGFSNMNMNVNTNGGLPSRPLSTVNDSSDLGYLSRVSTNISSGSTGSTAQSLADSIRMGEAEDPYDRSLKRLDTPVKMPAPSLGPARFKDTKMFSTAHGNADIEFTGTCPPRRPQCPPPVPDWLNLALQGFRTPTLDEAFSALPFTELCRHVGPATGGVIRIKDIPYAATRQEMTAFVGRNAQILQQPEGSPYHSVHIMMERESGKTMDCFIELATPNEAAWVVRQFANRVNTKRPPKVGDRVVEVVYSSQDELLTELFPRAKHVRWSGGQPAVDTTARKYYDGQSAAGFQGFMHSEELVALQKHAQLNDRSLFASKSPCRVYESMITTLHKYPWYAVDYVTINERRAVFDCFMALLRSLVEQLRRGQQRQGPLDASPSLLQEFVVAALTCPGFSEKQKAAIVARLHQTGFSSMVDARHMNVNLGGVNEFSSVWPFAVLSYIPGTDDALIQYFAALLREATATPKPTSLAAVKAAEATGQLASPMGEFKIDYGHDAGTLSLAEVAKIEYNKIEQLLKIACMGNIGLTTLSAPASASRGSGDNSMSSGGNSSSEGARSLY